MILQDFYKHNQNKVLRQENEIIRLRAQLNSYSNYDSLGLKICPRDQNPISQGGNDRLISKDDQESDCTGSESDTHSTVAIILLHTDAERQRKSNNYHAWLTTRLNVEKLEIITENQ